MQYLKRKYTGGLFGLVFDIFNRKIAFPGKMRAYGTCWNETPGSFGWIAEMWNEKQEKSRATM